MPPDGQGPTTSTAGSRFWAWSWPCLVGLVGLLAAHHPMLVSGFQRVQTDPVDSRFVNYVLEHGARWVAASPGHESFWSPPFFFPAHGVAAYSDTLLSVSPPYWLMRAAGFAPDTSYQFWMLAASLFNFGLFFWLLRRGFGLGPYGGSAGAYLFAFGAPRVNQLGHSQLLPQGFTVLVILALVELTREGTSARGRWLWGAIAGLSLAAQLYACVYWGWFLGVGLLIAAVLWGLDAVVRRKRRGLAQSFKRLAGPGLLGVSLGALTAAPLAWRWWVAARDLGLRDIEDVRPMLAGAASWIYHGPQSWLWGWTAEFEPFCSITVEHEQRLGMGLVVPLLIVGGVAAGGKRRRLLRLVVLATLVMAGLGVVTPGGFTLWEQVRELVPGASALRAVSRVGMLLLIPGGIAVGVALEGLGSRGRLGRMAAVLLGVLAAVEQGVTTPSFDKQADRTRVEVVARRVDPKAAAFYFSPGVAELEPWTYHRDPNLRNQNPVWRTHLDAMWAGLVVGKPTCNGYSGNVPPGWMPLAASYVLGPADERRVANALGSWAETQGPAAHRVDWVRP